MTDLLERLRYLRELKARAAEADRATFLARWPTPGHMAVELSPVTLQTPALEAIDRELADLMRGSTTRLMLFCPPQEGKSSRVSCWQVLWRLALEPGLRIAVVSYAASKAERWGRWLRRMIRYHPELGIQLMADSRAVDRFETTAGGSVVCVGIEGGITGEPADLIIIDDPVRGRAEAESPTYRQHAWEWWESNAATRLSARGQVVLMMTRWSADDLAGRLLTREPGEWRVLRIPAIAEPGTDVRGHDGSSAYAPNGELISVRGRDPGFFLGLRAKRSAYVWRSVYAQNPVAPEGNLFRRPDFRYWHKVAADPSRLSAPLNGRRIDVGGVAVALDDCWRFITCDLAASKKTSADWTVLAVWAITRDGFLVLLDRARERIEESAMWELARPLVARWQALDVFVERGFIGTTLIVDATRAGVRVQPLDPDRDKVTRALPATYRVKGHAVAFPSGAEWLDEWCDELAGFPTGAHDDQVDTFSYAARIASAHWVTPDRFTHAGNGHRPDVGAQALTAATGADLPVNFDTVQF